MKNGPYILIVAPENYPGKKYRDKYVYEHQLVWWQHYGKIVPDECIIHHIDKNKHNNHVTNLEMKTRSLHTKEHCHGKTLVDLNCGYCKINFTKEVRQINCKVSKGQTRFYCCRSHQVTHQQQMRYGLIVSA